MANARNSAASEPGPARSAEAETEPGPARSAGAETEPGLARSAGAETEPGPARSAGAETEPGPARSAGAETEPGLARSAGAETEPGLARSAGAETEPGLAHSAGAETEPGLARSAGAESEPGLARSAGAETEPGLARSAGAETEPGLACSAGAESEPGLARSAGAETEPGLARSAGAANRTRGGGRRRLAPRKPRRRVKAECKSCGGQHDGATCRFSSSVCKVCNKQGHLVRACPCPYLNRRLKSEIKYEYYELNKEPRMDDEDCVKMMRVDGMPTHICSECAHLKKKLKAYRDLCNNARLILHSKKFTNKLTTEELSHIKQIAVLNLKRSNTKTESYEPVKRKLTYSHKFAIDINPEDHSNTSENEIDNNIKIKEELDHDFESDIIQYINKSLESNTSQDNTDDNVQIKQELDLYESDTMQYNLEPHDKLNTSLHETDDNFEVKDEPAPDIERDIIQYKIKQKHIPSHMRILGILCTPHNGKEKYLFANPELAPKTLDKSNNAQHERSVHVEDSRNNLRAYEDVEMRTNNMKSTALDDEFVIKTQKKSINGSITGNIVVERKDSHGNMMELNRKRRFIYNYDETATGKFVCKDVIIAAEERQTKQNNRIITNVFEREYLKYPSLWDSHSLNYRNKFVNRRCLSQLLHTLNQTSIVPLTIEDLYRRIACFKQKIFNYFGTKKLTLSLAKECFDIVPPMAKLVSPMAQIVPPMAQIVPPKAQKVPLPIPDAPETPFVVTLAGSP